MASLRRRHRWIRAAATSRLREGRGVSDQYGVRDAECPISTG